MHWNLRIPSAPSQRLGRAQRVRPAELSCVLACACQSVPRRAREGVMKWATTGPSLIVAVVLAAGGTFGAVTVQAQATASIRGTVVDPLGARVPDAAVRLL